MFGSGKGQEKQNASTGANWGGQLSTESGQTLGEVQPFLQNELISPTGFGQPTVNQMKTTAGESAAAGVGSAAEQARLNASRTGNTAATPGIIDAATRAAQAGETTAANNVDVQNALLKNAQSQAGASGLESIYGKQLGASLQSLGLSNQAAGQQTQASTAGVGDVLGILGAAGGLGTAGANAYSTVENA
jgi:hypothetical protein